MKHTQSLKRNGDFRRLYSRGKSFAGGYVAVYAQKNRRPFNRLGITVSKATGNAVTRNRAKRVIRAAYTNLEDELIVGLDLVVVMRTRGTDKKEQQIRKDLDYALRKLNLKKTDDVK